MKLVITLIYTNYQMTINKSIKKNKNKKKKNKNHAYTNMQ
jgi:hypothetical protein